MSIIRTFCQYLENYHKSLVKFSREICTIEKFTKQEEENTRNHLLLFAIENEVYNHLSDLIEVINNRKVLTDFVTLSDVLYNSDFTDEEVWEVLLYFIRENTKVSVSPFNGVTYRKCEICKNIISCLDEDGFVIEGKKDILLNYLKELSLGDRIIAIIEKIVCKKERKKERKKDIPQNCVYATNLRKIYGNRITRGNTSNIYELTRLIEWFSFERPLSDNNVFLGYLNSSFINEMISGFTAEELMSFIIYVTSRNISSGLLKSDTQLTIKYRELGERQVSDSEYVNVKTSTLIYHYITLIGRDELVLNASEDSTMYPLFKTSNSKFLKIVLAYARLYQYLIEKYNSWSKVDIVQIREALSILNLNNTAIERIISYLNSKVVKEETMNETSTPKVTTNTPQDITPKVLKDGELQQLLKEIEDRINQITSYNLIRFRKQENTPERITLSEIIKYMRKLQCEDQTIITRLVKCANEYTLKLLEKTYEYAKNAGTVDLDTLLINPWDLYKEYRDKINYYATSDLQAIKVHEVDSTLQDIASELNDIYDLAMEEISLQTEGETIKEFCDKLMKALRIIDNITTYEKIQCGMISNRPTL